MPVKKTHPGLDEAMSDEALEAFMDGAPTWVTEPARSLWPVTAYVSILALTVGLILGILLADLVTALDVIAVAVVTAGAVTVLLRLDQPGRRGR